MLGSFGDDILEVLRNIEDDGLTKTERLIGGPQGARITVHGKGAEKREMLNLCANNYLGLANHRDVREGAIHALNHYGYGMASVRFICGTLDLHRELETAVARYLRKDDAILFAACFDANGGLFEALLTEEDAIISDALNHASIIDGVRLSKARRYRYQTSDMDYLETQLKQAVADGARFRLIVTDGVFSMDGYIAPLQEICDLAETYDALVFVDDSHAVGFVGEHGRGTPEYCGVEGRVERSRGRLVPLGQELRAVPLNDVAREHSRVDGGVGGGQPCVDEYLARAREALVERRGHGLTPSSAVIPCSP